MLGLLGLLVTSISDITSPSGFNHIVHINNDIMPFVLVVVLEL